MFALSKNPKIQAVVCLEYIQHAQFATKKLKVILKFQNERIHKLKFTQNHFSSRVINWIDLEFMHMIKLYFWNYLNRAKMWKSCNRKICLNDLDFSMLQLIRMFLYNSLSLLSESTALKLPLPFSQKREVNKMRAWFGIFTAAKNWKRVNRIRRFF